MGNIEIEIGNGVKLCDRITIAGMFVKDRPRLIIGDNTNISQPITIIAGNEIIIGSNCLIGCTMISDNPGHRTDYKLRFEKLPEESLGRIVIGDYVWAALQSIILGNVSIGFGAIIGARAVVTKNIPPFCMVAGNPARIVKKLPFPKDMIEKLGNEAYRMYEKATVER